MGEKYIIQIYSGGVLARHAVRGRKKLEAERAILAKILGEERVRQSASLPTADPGHDFYALSPEQLMDYRRLQKAPRSL